MKRRSMWIATLILVGACNSGGDGGSDPAITSVTIQSPPATAGPKQVLNLKAVVQGTGDFNDAVTWSAQGGGSFTDSSANPASFTTPDVSVETVVTVKATSVADPSKSNSAEITVQPGELGELQPRVDTTVQPDEPSIPNGDGDPEPVARSQDAYGLASDFVESIVLLRPAGDAELQAFLAKYGGTILGDDTVPEPPDSLGVTLTDAQRKPTEYRIKITLSTVDAAQFAANAAMTGLGGSMSFSSQEGLLTMAGVADAVANGYDASPDFLSKPQQSFPQTVLSTAERPKGAANTNAFNTVQFQTTGSQSNITRAWQFVAAHGIQRRTRIAIIDDGFWLNNGAGQGTDWDLPNNPIQYDFINNDYIADGANATGCGAGNPCYWHGTGCAATATGIANNRLGDAGSGGWVADPMLFKASTRRSNANWAIRTAVAWGADVVSMSWGGDCNLACRIYDRDHTPVSDAIDSGSTIVFFAAAGNGQGNPGVGYDVGDPHFVHPCIEDHVICVGALNDGGTTPQTYSNFGGSVQIFAPTNIPVMAQPGGSDQFGTGAIGKTTFGGTSASTPFMAGVAAMMKAINPDLNNAQVGTIIRETAHPGSGNVSRYVDAYAAVRRAAEGIPAVKDRFEGGPGGKGAVANATQLTGGGPYNQGNLNIDRANERDFFSFDVPGQSVMTLNLQYPDALSSMSLVEWDTAGGCGLPVLISQTALTPAGTGKQFVYAIPGGNYKVAVTGTDINAYNLGISFAAPAVAADSYEPNETVDAARWVHSYRPVGAGKFDYIAIDPRFTLDATLGSAVDHDWYKVRGTDMTLAEQVEYIGFCGVKVYANESPLSVEVYKINADKSTTLISNTNSASCAAQPVAVRLEPDVYYYVHVFGNPGKYTLYNGLEADPRRLPDLIHNWYWEIIHPGGPVEREINWPLAYLFVNDNAWSKLRAKAPGVHFELYDMQSVKVADGIRGDDGFEFLDLSTLAVGVGYVAAVTPQNGPATLRMEWEPTTPMRSSGNLVVNGNAEQGPGNDANGYVEDIPGWSIPDDYLDYPTVIYYNGINGVPTSDSPGPTDRGEKLFAGGPDTDESGLGQLITVDPSWRQAIDEGRVNVNFSAYLGGTNAEEDYAYAFVRLLDPNYKELARIDLAPVTPTERENITGLLPVAGDTEAPPGTYYLAIQMHFVKKTYLYNDGYIDNLELTLSEYE